MKKHDVIIIGTGTAALAAAEQVKKKTDNFIIVSNGVYGTTCVRAGCMPSKVFIQAAQLFHQRKLYERMGISGSENLRADIPELLHYVRQMRAHFLEFTLECTEQYRPYIVEAAPWFHAPDEIELNGTRHKAGAVILATGSTPIIPPELAGMEDMVITSDTLFDQEDLPTTLGVMGMSILGAEMAQAFARLGIKVTAYSDQPRLAGLTDLAIHEYAMRQLRSEMTIAETMPRIAHVHGGISFGDHTVEKIFVAMSRSANLENMGLEALRLIRPGQPVMEYNPETMQVGDLPLFVAGDVKLGRSILNEASDEGKIAGYNAVSRHSVGFRRRTGLQITYTSPTIAVIGKTWDELNPHLVVIGEVSYEDQGKAKLICLPKGMLRLYAERKTKRVVGAELMAPDGDHLAHALAWLIDSQITIPQALNLPFYHPALEEGIRSALRDIATQLNIAHDMPERSAANRC